MQKQWRTSFENIGSSSYLAVTFPVGIPVVGYQLEMITSNEISHFLPASRRMINGETSVYYQISSKIQLSQILERRKLTRKELTCLIRGAIEAIQDGAEYQLPEEGLVMEADSIYVVPDTCSPSFVYIPAEVDRGDGLKGFLLSLIMRGQIEMSSDNFIQVLLETLNRETLSYQDLAACLEPHRGRSGMPGGQNGAGQAGGVLQAGGAAMGGIRGGGYAGSPQQGIRGGYGYGPQQSFGSGYGVYPQQQTEGGQPGSLYQNAGAGAGGSAPQEPGTRPEVPAQESQEGREGKKRFGAKPKDQKKSEKKGKSKAAAKKAEASSPEGEDGFDREKAKKKFLLPQAVIMVAVAALVSFGAFTDESGGIVLNNVLAVVLILAVAEIVLYREAYVNSRSKSGSQGGEKDRSKDKKKPGGKKRAETAGTKAANRPPVAPRKPPVPGRPAMPGASSAAGGALESGGYAPSGYAAPGPTSSFTPGGMPPQDPAAFGMPSGGASGSAGGMWQSAAGFSAAAAGDTMLADTGGDTELWDGDPGADAYLEYYVNGVLSRVPLNKPSTLIGRLSSQVDFAVSNPKVGKIHAEFLNQGGKIYIKDLNSKNGTYLNRSGERLGSNVPYPLSDGDRISLADSEFTLRCGTR